jgi:hypothetical protein
MTAATIARRLAALEAKATKQEDPNRLDWAAMSDEELAGYCVRLGLMTEGEAERFLCRGDPVKMYRLNRRESVPGPHPVL